jgi:hypothetical protein
MSPFYLPIKHYPLAREPRSDKVVMCTGCSSTELECHPFVLLPAFDRRL